MQHSSSFLTFPSEVVASPSKKLLTFVKLLLSMKTTPSQLPISLWKENSHPAHFSNMLIIWLLFLLGCRWKEPSSSSGRSGSRTPGGTFASPPTKRGSRGAEWLSTSCRRNCPRWWPVATRSSDILIDIWIHSGLTLMLLASPSWIVNLSDHRVLTWSPWIPKGSVVVS